jgi:hypothetical protein
MHLNLLFTQALIQKSWTKTGPRNGLKSLMFWSTASIFPLKIRITNNRFVINVLPTRDGVKTIEEIVPKTMNSNHARNIMSADVVVNGITFIELARRWQSLIRVSTLECQQLLTQRLWAVI